MNRKRQIAAIATTLCVSAQLALSATIGVQGAVTALTHVSQISHVTGVAGFEGANPFPGYATQGLTFGNWVDISTLLPGVTTHGLVSPPIVLPGSFTWTGTDGQPKPVFPGPLSGGGVASSNFIQGSAAAVFSVPVTQFGLTAGKTSPMYITAWNPLGQLIGQVSWDTGSGSDPDSLAPAGFVGMDTHGVPIALIAWGNYDIYSGLDFEIAGTTPTSDTWVWGSPTAVPEPSTYAMLGGGLALGLAMWLRRRPRLGAS